MQERKISLLFLIASKRRQPIALAHNFHLLVRLLFNTRPHASARQANFVFVFFPSLFRCSVSIDLKLQRTTNIKKKKKKSSVESTIRLPAPHRNFVLFFVFFPSQKEKKEEVDSAPSISKGRDITLTHARTPPTSSLPTHNTHKCVSLFHCVLKNHTKSECDRSKRESAVC